MKKLTNKQKRANTRYGEKRFQRKLKSKKKRKERRKRELRGKVLANRSKKFEDVSPPKNYSFVENTKEFLEYISRAQKIAKDGYSVSFNLTDIDNLTFDALCYLMAVTREKNIFGRVRGTIPEKAELRELFMNSGFVKKIADKDYQPPENKIIEGEMINNATNKSYSAEVSQYATKKIVKHSYDGDRISSPKIHPVFVELMNNTDEHAGEGYNRRLFYFKDKNDVTRVCFLDLGQGILGSLRTKAEKLGDKVSSRIGENQNTEILKRLLEGSIKKSSKRTKTREQKRGKGLPFVKKFMDNNLVKNAYIITNNIRGDLTKNEFTDLGVNFGGTLYYWEMHPLTSKLSSGHK